MKALHLSGIAALLLTLTSAQPLFAQMGAASLPAAPVQVAPAPPVAPAVQPSQTDPQNTLRNIDLDNYKLTAGDSISILVYEEEDISTNSHITKDGTVTIPLIGQVKVTGLTCREAGDRIRDTLVQKQILVSPKVTVVLQAASQNSFIMLGQISRPGTYSFSSQETMNLVQAIAMAGGLTRIANPHDVTVVRRDGGVQQNFHVDAKKMTMRSDVTPFEIKSGDVVTIGETFF